MTTVDVVGPDRAPPPPEEEQLPGGLAGLYQRGWLNLRTGNLGPFPIIVGEIVVVFIFGLTATNFFTAVNFVNLITQTAGTAMLAYGVVYRAAARRDRPLDRLSRRHRSVDRRGAPAARDRAGT